MSTKYVLFIVTNAGVIGPKKRKTGFFFPEIAHPFEVLDKAGVAVEFASLEGGRPPEDGFDESDHVQTDFLKTMAYQRLGHSRKLSEVDVLNYDAIFIPGGLGPMVDIGKNPQIIQAVSRAWDAGKVVSAVCHGPVAFLDVKLADGSSLIKGRKLTSFSKSEEYNYAREDVPYELEDALREQGAIYSSVADWQPNLVVDGRLITGQNPASGGLVGQAIIDAFKKQ
ncbi:type 1 glutamine amidotransferase domain-containing protein [Pseudomonas sp. NPDC090202]|uniref:type 1 glutamine amidotransferase domain-containing protein n=1 Tax=unclassified Pseudomonas TaxID=196821 RepID=UPI00380BF3D8